MSAIQSLFRIMTLRDADSLHLESCKVPELRRRGRAEPMAMPALEAELIEGFVGQVTTEADRANLTQGSVAVSFVDPDGAAYTVSIHPVASGFQLVARRASLGRGAGSAASGPAAATGSGGGHGAPSILGSAGGLASAGAGPGAGAVGSSGPGTTSGTTREATSGLTTGATSAAAFEVAGGARAPAPAQLGPSLIAAVIAARDRGASDLFVSTERSARLRVHGGLEAVPGVQVEDGELRALYAALVGVPAGASVGAAAEAAAWPAARGLHGDGGRDAGSADFAVAVDGVRVRCNVFGHLDGIGLAVRLLSDEAPALGELGLPPSVATAVEHREGLVLVCGPTGSGKTTTLAALLRQLDHARAAHVITLEDPIEYRLRARRGLIHQRELGTHISSFASGLRAALREGPDVILLGELRDAETIAAALTAAETGHLVLATMHAPGAAGAIDRILDAFEQGRQQQVRTQLAGSLRMIITQHLLPRQGGGRVAAAEVVPVTAAVANIIRKGELQTLATAILSGREAGMVPLERSLAQLLQRGWISEADASRVARDPQLLRAQLG